ncbi:hypothetical protein Ssi03_46050 [Sphaerisporangium siamense]|uniref:Uncharacterized protein n=1 Tax=Sphaerisporangium siamense TaxID=795645 RepID=A0A7W7D5D0_9ACTN|nr:DUF6221 family protein [Sphaerisporangium siamense]MBB4699258.1 hypothetical protein [Sphaerisporangium siamense]GII86615.1 hypothetical protein Ssi03_46050 [Sphaerisporangium siamense]
MDDLVAFLRARLDEDEQMARAAGGAWQYVALPDVISPAGHSLQLDDDRALVDVGFMEDDALRPAEAQHIAHHDPARVLREVEAKRRLIEAHVDHYGLVFDHFWPVPVLSLLALPYADHADYREEWRP